MHLTNIILLTVESFQYKSKEVDIFHVLNTKYINAPFQNTS
jgi:hypothetical protein